ncbi:cupin domain-containing protein [Variovorax sp. J22R24]|uniref:cupin domain-containing protein n=1 Tax=Variovorax gracilis TaxID=3053502 RepID=UPI002576829B|nr:cupin domain-containing protein [Variovorax sp. J22R24]MDM0107604.1 cupin domain-containing protein [Variovorax sp. J22R24]
MSFPPIHRVVTGHDDKGRAVVSSDGPLATVVELQGIEGVVFHEVWSTAGTPAAIDNGPDPTPGPLMLPPPRNGTRVRFVDIPPDTPELLSRSAADMQAGFQEIGDAGASTAGDAAPHPLMHRTETVDYGIVIEGELTLVLDKGEVALKAGSVVVQRGTNHAWANRSDKPCRMLFVLVDGTYNEGMATTLRERN